MKFSIKYLLQKTLPACLNIIIHTLTPFKLEWEIDLVSWIGIRMFVIKQKFEYFKC